jgi:hypothetical protein
MAATTRSSGAPLAKVRIDVSERRRDFISPGVIMGAVGQGEKKSTFF